MPGLLRKSQESVCRGELTIIPVLHVLLFVVLEGGFFNLTSRGNLKCTKTSVRPEILCLLFETLFLHFKLEN